MCFAPNLVGEFALIIGVSVLCLAFCTLKLWKEVLSISYRFSGAVPLRTGAPNGLRFSPGVCSNAEVSWLRRN